MNLSTRWRVTPCCESRSVIASFESRALLATSLSRSWKRVHRYLYALPDSCLPSRYCACSHDVGMNLWRRGLTTVFLSMLASYIARRLLPITASCRCGGSAASSCMCRVSVASPLLHASSHLKSSTTCGIGRGSFDRFAQQHIGTDYAANDLSHSSSICTEHLPFLCCS